MNMNKDLEKVCKLVGSGDLLSGVEKFALAILATRSDIPVTNIDNEIEAVKLYLAGLQDPESDLFVDA
jgi:hypothetical protein